MPAPVEDDIYTSDDDLSQFPSAASPLSSTGVDPDLLRANPDALANLSKASQPSPLAQPGMPGAVPDTSNLSMGDRKASVPFPATQPQLEPKVDTPAAPSTGATGATADTKPTDPEGYGLKGMDLLYKEAQAAGKSAEEIPTTPPADVKALQEKRDKLATPPVLYDPRTGKMLPNVQEFDVTTGANVDVHPKPSVGSRVWRGVRGGLVGLATGGVSGAIAGAVDPALMPGGRAYGAPNKAYEQAEQTREQQLGATNSQLDTAFKSWKDAVDAAKAKSGEFRAVGGLGKDVVTGAKDLITAEAKPETEDRKAQAKLDLDQKEFTQRGQQADRLGLKGDKRALYIANGKLPDPRQATEGEIALWQAMKTFAQENGRPPQTIEEFNKVRAAANGTLDKGTGRGTPTPQQIRAISDKKAAGIEKANTEFAKQQYMPSGRQNYQRQLQEIQNAFEEDMADIGQAGVHNVVTVNDKGQVTWTPEGTAPAVPTPPVPPSAAPAQPAAQNQPAGKPQPAPDGTRVKLANGTTQVKRDGKWVNE